MNFAFGFKDMAFKTFVIFKPTIRFYIARKETQSSVFFLMNSTQPSQEEEKDVRSMMRDLAS